MSTTYSLPKTEVQAYTETRPAVLPTAQVTLVYLQPVQVIPASIWTIEMTDGNQIVHVVTYHASASDGPTEILDGILDAFRHPTVADPFLDDLSVIMDYPQWQLTIVSPGYILVQASVTPPYPATIWEEMFFPLAIADQVMTGALGDLLAEWGQTDKAAAVQQGVSAEMQIADTKFETTPNPALSGQQRPLSRYKL